MVVFLAPFGLFLGVIILLVAVTLIALGLHWRKESRRSSAHTGDMRDQA